MSIREVSATTKSKAAAPPWRDCPLEDREAKVGGKPCGILPVFGKAADSILQDQRLPEADQKSQKARPENVPLMGLLLAGKNPKRSKAGRTRAAPPTSETSSPPPPEPKSQVPSIANRVPAMSDRTAQELSFFIDSRCDTKLPDRGQPRPDEGKGVVFQNQAVQGREAPLTEGPHLSGMKGSIEEPPEIPRLFGIDIDPGGPGGLPGDRRRAFRREMANGPPPLLRDPDYGGPEGRAEDPDFRVRCSSLRMKKTCWRRRIPQKVPIAAMNTTEYNFTTDAKLSVVKSRRFTQHEKYTGNSADIVRRNF